MTNVLVVEDDRPSGLILKKLLDKFGYFVTDVVETGEDAIQKIGQNRPDIVLLDISLAGDMDGIETAKQIYRDYRIPFIYITAGTDDKTFDRAKETLPFNYIVKPFNERYLSSSIEMAMYKFEMEQKLLENAINKKKILDALPDEIFELKPDRTPYTDADFETMNRIWSGDILKKADPYLNKALSSGKVLIFEFEKGKEPDVEYFESRIVPLEGNYILIITRNVSDKMAFEHSLKNQVSRLEDSVRESADELQKLNASYVEEAGKRTHAEEEKMLLTDAVEQSSSSIIIVERKGIVRYVNGAFLELSGYTREELSNLDITRIPNPIIPEEGIVNQLRAADVWKGELYNINKNGEIYFVNTTISKIRDEKGDVRFYVITGENITQKKKDEILIEKMKTALKGSSWDTIDKDMDWQAWKEKMLSRNVSRVDKSIFSNINNSFTQGAGFGTLITFMEMIAGSSEEKDGKKIIDSELFAEAMRNVRIIQDAFKIFSGIDWVISHTIPFEVITVRDIYSLLKDIINKHSKYIELNKNTIVINDFPKVLRNKTVNINKEYFSEAVSELIINALKFSRSASQIIIMIYAQHNSLRISIINDPQKTGDGILGIPVEYEKLIFEPFFRISKLVYEKYNSLDFGIGLSFVEKIIVKHGGEIFAENILDYSDIKKDSQTKVSLMISLPFLRDEE